MRELDVLAAALLKAAFATQGGSRESTSKGTETGVYDVVTESDMTAESIILDSIRRSFPEDTIVSEETSPDAVSEGRTWAVDPIDGTLNFSRGIPLYGMQGVFMEDGVPRASSILLPETGELFTASEEGAFVDGRPLRTSRYRPLRECVLTTGDFSRRSQAFRGAQAVLLSECRDCVARFKMLGAACVDFAYLASGRTDVHVRFVNRIWDFMPGLYLAERAGAMYDRGLMDEYGLLILCSCEDVLDEALEALAPKLVDSLRRSV